VGSSKAKSPAWNRAYRSLEHGFAKAALFELARQVDDSALKVLSQSFAALQQFRHEADYDPHKNFAAGSDGGCVALARLGISVLTEMSADLRIELATSLLLRTRR
jgi:hypothetical protein